MSSSECKVTFYFVNVVKFSSFDLGLAQNA